MIEGTHLAAEFPGMTYSDGVIHWRGLRLQRTFLDGIPFGGPVQADLVPADIPLYDAVYLNVPRLSRQADYDTVKRWCETELPRYHSYLQEYDCRVRHWRRWEWLEMLPFGFLIAPKRPEYRPWQETIA